MAAAAAAALAPPRRLRVASVLPAATEALCFIGGASLLVGRSHEDNYPPEITHLPMLTTQHTTYTTAADVDQQVREAVHSGTALYGVEVDVLKSLRPDVILTQDICSVCAVNLQTVERVAASISPSPRVVSLNPENLEDVLANILAVGEAVGMQAEARAAHESILRRLANVDALVRLRHTPGPSVAFIEWPDPIYVGGHWTPELIRRAGGRHPCNEPKVECGGGAGKSFAVSPEAIVASAPDLVIVCPCGLDLPATRKEAARLEVRSLCSPYTSTPLPP